MSLEALKDRLPDYAKDQFANLGQIAGSTALTPAQAWTVAIAAAASTKNKLVLEHLIEEAKLEPAAVTAAKGAATVMAMTNVYYRSMHFLGGDYEKLPARLRMQIIAKPGIAHLDFELACLAASAIEGCERCVVSHERSAREKGATVEAIQDAIRIAAIVNATAAALT